MIMIGPGVGDSLVLYDLNKNYDSVLVAPSSADLYWHYVDEPSSASRYVSTVPLGVDVVVPLSTEIDRDITIRAIPRTAYSPASAAQDLATAEQVTAKSDRLRQAVLTVVGTAGARFVRLGVDNWNRFSRVRRVDISATGFETDEYTSLYWDLDARRASGGDEGEANEFNELPDFIDIERLPPDYPASISWDTDTYFVRVAHSVQSSARATGATYRERVESLRYSDWSDTLEFDYRGGGAGTVGAGIVGLPLAATFEAGVGSGLVDELSVSAVEFPKASAYRPGILETDIPYGQFLGGRKVWAGQQIFANGGGAIDDWTRDGGNLGPLKTTGLRTAPTLPSVSSLTYHADTSGDHVQIAAVGVLRHDTNPDPARYHFYRSTHDAGVTDDPPFFDTALALGRIAPAVWTDAAWRYSGRIDFALEAAIAEESDIVPVAVDIYGGRTSSDTTDATGTRGLRIDSRGDAVLGVGALAVDAVGGFAYLPQFVGTPTTSAPAITHTGYVPAAMVGTALRVWNGSAWVGVSGANPAGSGTELQYRVDGSTFGAVTGSSVSGDAITLTGSLKVMGGTFTGAGIPTGADTPTRLAVTDGTSAAPSTSDSPAVSIARVLDNDYVGGSSGVVHIHGTKSGTASTDGFETLSVWARQTTAIEDGGLCAIYGRVVADVFGNNSSHWTFAGDMQRWVRTDSTVFEFNPNGVISKTVADVSESSGTITIVTTTNHGFDVGDAIWVTGVGGAIGANGHKIITAVPTLDEIEFSGTLGGAYTSGGTVWLGGHEDYGTVGNRSQGQIIAAAGLGAHTAAIIIDTQAVGSGFVTGIDFRPGVIPTDISNKAIRIPNATYLHGWNNAGTTSYPLIGLHSTDGVVIDPAALGVFLGGGLALSTTIAFPDNVRQTFNPGATNAGLNVGAHAGAPSSLTDGDLWYDSTATQLKARINGATVSLGAGAPAGSGTELQYKNGSVFGAVSGSSVSGAAVTLGGTLSVAASGSLVAAYTTGIFEVARYSASNYPILKFSRTDDSDGDIADDFVLGGIVWYGKVSGSLDPWISITGTYDNATGNRLALTSSVIHLAGNVGIGTSAPSAALHVSGSVRLDLGSDADGDTYYRLTSNVARLAIGASGTFYKSNGSAPTWAALAAGDIASGTLAIARGGTGLNTAPSNGQLLIGNSGTAYSLATLTAGDNISVTNGAGSITIAATPTGSATELQYKNGSVFGALSGSTVSGSNLYLGGALGVGTATVSQRQLRVLYDVTATSSLYYGASVEMTLSPASSASGLSAYGLYVEASTTTAQAVGTVFGMAASVTHGQAAVLGDVRGMDFSLSQSASGGSITTAYGAKIVLALRNSTTAYGSHVLLQPNGLTGGVTTAYGYYANANWSTFTLGTWYGCYLDTSAANITNRYGLIVTANGGMSAMGHTVPVASRLHIKGDGTYAPLRLQNDAQTILQEFAGANGEFVRIKQATALLEVGGGDGLTSLSASNLIPAGATLLAVTARVTSTFSGSSATSFDLGDNATQNLFGDNKALTAGTTVDSTHYLSGTWIGPRYYASASDVIVTANGGTFTTPGGAVRITITYYDTTAPTG